MDKRFIEDIEILKETLKLFFKEVAKIWDEIKRIADGISDARERIKEKDCLRTTWIVPVDTRKLSQVNDRKPLFSIQKII